MPQAIIEGVGIQISIEVGIDINNATILEIRYTKPDGTTGKWDLGDGVSYVAESGKHYVRFTSTVNTQIDQEGRWKFEVYAVGPGYELYGTETKYKFEDNMEGTFT